MTRLSIRLGAVFVAAIVAMPADSLMAQRNRRASGGSVRQTRSQATRQANVNRNVNVNRTTNVNVNRNVNVNTRPARRGGVVVGDEGAVAVGRRGAVAVGEGIRWRRKIRRGRGRRAV